MRSKHHGHQDPAAQFAVETRPLDEIVPYDNNPRLNDDAVAKVAASLAQYGWQQPIVVDEEGVIIVGHTRLKAAYSLGMTHAPVHVAVLSADDARAYRIADNRTGAEAEWAFPKLVHELRLLEDSGYDLGLTGFDAFELTPLMATDWSPPPVTEPEGPEPAPSESGHVTFGPDQWESVLELVEKVRATVGDPHMKTPAALLLAAQAGVATFAS